MTKGDKCKDPCSECGAPVKRDYVGEGEDFRERHTYDDTELHALRAELRTLKQNLDDSFARETKQRNRAAKYKAEHDELVDAQVKFIKGIRAREKAAEDWVQEHKTELAALRDGIESFLLSFRNTPTDTLPNWVWSKIDKLREATKGGG